MAPHLFFASLHSLRQIMVNIINIVTMIIMNIIIINTMMIMKVTLPAWGWPTTVKVDNRALSQFCLKVRPS